MAAVALTAAFGNGIPTMAAPSALADNSGSCNWNSARLFADQRRQRVHELVLA